MHLVNGSAATLIVTRETCVEMRIEKPVLQNINSSVGCKIYDNTQSSSETAMEIYLSVLTKTSDGLTMARSRMDKFLF